MSFDETLKTIQYNGCLNPFRAGRCLSTHLMRLKEVLGIGLNPFRAGRCLSTEYEDGSVRDNFGLNPFRAGRCLSTINLSPKEGNYESQSLSSRAMSFDIKVGTTSETTNVSIPFEQGDVFRRLQMRQVRWQYLVSIPFEQGDVFRRNAME